MLDRLVAVSVLSHVHYLHFTHFVDHATAFHTLFARNDKDGIHHVVELFLASHQVDQSLRIMEYAETPVPAVTFAELAAPVYCIKFGVEHTFVVFAYHQFAFRVVDVLVVECTLFEDVDFACRFAQFLA